MNYPLISEYIEAIKSAEHNFKELTNLRPVIGDDGQPIKTTGNFAVIFKMKDERNGIIYALKCFTKKQEGRAEAYRHITEVLKDVESSYLVSIHYYDKELHVDTKQTTETKFPVLLMDWVEGKTLDKYLRENLDNKFALEMLAYRFSQLSQWLIPQPFAHGDLKPDNILVREDGSLVLVDYDGIYVPAMKGQKARELGSPDFRHPLRTESDFNEFIDDFPITTILFSLNLIAKDSSLLAKFGSNERLLLSKQDYCNIDDSVFINYITTNYNGFFYDTNLNLLESTLKHRRLKDNDLDWFSILNRLLEVPSQVEIPKIKVSFNGAEFTMIYVKGNTFLIGERNKKNLQNYIIEAEEALGKGNNDNYIKKVKINSFWISESLVTMDVWPWFLDNPDGIYPYNIRERRKDDNSYGVFGVSYEDCRQFMRLLSKATNIKFDFPTETEWEYAARGGEHSKDYVYSGSDNLDEVAIYGKEIKDHGIPLCKVKTKKPNELGIYDMSGGLYEWCKDVSPYNKVGNNFIQHKSHHIRGGCMNSIAKKCRVTYRGMFYEKEYYEWEPYEWEPFWWQVGLRIVAREINTEIIKGNIIPSYSCYTTEDDDKNAITDEFGAKYSADGKKLISVPKKLNSYRVKDGVEIICHEAFFASQIEEVKLPNSVLLIGNQAFWGAKKLKVINIPNKVFFIGVQAFYNCVSLNSVNLSQSVNYIESSGFSGCSSLRQISIPINVDILENDLLSYCKSLECVELPKSLTIIGENVFMNCKSLQVITIPRNVNEITNNPFRGSGITEVVCETPSFVYENGFLMTADKTELVACLSKKKFISIPSSVKIIRAYAFNGCETVVQVFLPDGLTDINEYAFSECFALSELIIPDSVRRIQQGFLNECPNILRLIIHSKDIWIDKYAFYKTDNIIQIIIPKEIKESFNKDFTKYSDIVEDY